MLKIRIIPTLLWNGSELVKGEKFDNQRRIGSVLPAIKVYNMRKVDELILLDIMATQENRLIDCAQVADFAKECFVPFTVGGGISSIDDIKKILNSGADKVCINSFAYKDPQFIRQASNYFGKQCIVVSIDVLKNSKEDYFCYSNSGKKNTGINVVEWVKIVEELGAGEILITSIDRDGTMQGYDFELIKKITNLVNIPIIASGGAANCDDIYEIISKTNISAVSIASIFNFTEVTPLDIKKYLMVKNIPVRK